ncbi:hypothetical protein IIY68_03305 [Candidatus Saccharibacteria bacterium]|nr:hypothetical protein [Candidatus Saccharibacteria bacterium]
MKNFKNRLNKNMWILSLLALLALLAIDIYFLILGLRWEIDFLGCSCWFASIALTIAYMVVCVLLLRSKILELYLSKIYQEMDRLYFHGFKIWRYFETDAISRLQDWLGFGMSYEMSVLAMLILKHNKTATLCRGDYYNEDGVFQTSHSWVEFKIPLCGWHVADFCWLSSGFANKKVIFRHYGGEFKNRWHCSHEDFWDMSFPNVLHKSMQRRKDSCILRDLSMFCGPSSEEDGFQEWCYSGRHLRYACDGLMLSFYAGGKLVSSRIIRDFVKNPKRRQPKARSIRIARFYEREFRKWRSQQKITY